MQENGRNLVELIYSAKNYMVDCIKENSTPQFFVYYATQNIVSHITGSQYYIIPYIAISGVNYTLFKCKIINDKTKNMVEVIATGVSIAKSLPKEIPTPLSTLLVVSASSISAVFRDFSIVSNISRVSKDISKSLCNSNKILEASLASILNKCAKSIIPYIKTSDFIKNIPFTKLFTALDNVKIPIFIGLGMTSLIVKIDKDGTGINTIFHQAICCTTCFVFPLYIISALKKNAESVDDIKKLQLSANLFQNKLYHIYDSFIAAVNIAFPIIVDDSIKSTLPISPIPNDSILKNIHNDIDSYLNLSYSIGRKIFANIVLNKIAEKIMDKDSYSFVQILFVFGITTTYWCQDYADPIATLPVLIVTSPVVRCAVRYIYLYHKAHEKVFADKLKQAEGPTYIVNEFNEDFVQVVAGLSVVQYQCWLMYQLTIGLDALAGAMSAGIIPGIISPAVQHVFVYSIPIATSMLAGNLADINAAAYNSHFNILSAVSRQNADSYLGDLWVRWTCIYDVYKGNTLSKIRIGNVNFIFKGKMYTQLELIKDKTSYGTILKIETITTERATLMNEKTGDSIGIEKRSDDTEYPLGKCAHYIHKIAEVTASVVKYIDVSIDGMRAMHEPTYGNMGKVILGSAQLYSMVHGFSGFIYVTTAVSVVMQATPQIIEGEYLSAARTAASIVAESAFYALVPVMTISYLTPISPVAGGICALLFVGGFAGYSIYNLVKNASSLYNELDSSDAEMRSGIVWLERYKDVYSALSYIPVVNSLHNFEDDVTYYQNKIEHTAELMGFKQQNQEKLYNYIYMPFISEKYKLIESGISEPQAAEIMQRKLVQITLSSANNESGEKNSTVHKYDACLEVSRQVDSDVTKYHCYSKDTDTVDLIAVHHSNEIEVLEGNFTAQSFCASDTCYSL